MSGPLIAAIPLASFRFGFGGGGCVSTFCGGITIGLVHNIDPIDAAGWSLVLGITFAQTNDIILFLVVSTGAMRISSR
jgi:hypothetical protein